MEHEAEIRTHLPENFKELTPRNAALALAQSHCPAALAPKLRFFSDAPADLSPPMQGEVGHEGLFVAEGRSRHLGFKARELGTLSDEG